MASSLYDFLEIQRYVSPVGNVVPPFQTYIDYKRDVILFSGVRKPCLSKEALHFLKELSANKQFSTKHGVVAFDVVTLWCCGWYWGSYVNKILHLLISVPNITIVYPEIREDMPGYHKWLCFPEGRATYVEPANE